MLGDCDSIPTESKKLFLTQPCPEWFWGHMRSNILATGNMFSELNLPKRETVHIKRYGRNSDHTDVAFPSPSRRIME
jgi:hypothetical protein